MIIILNKSRLLTILFVILYGLALLSVLISGIHLVLKALLLLTIIISLVDQARRHLTGAHKDSLVQLKLTGENVIKVRKAGNPDWLVAEITSSVIWPWILILKLKELSPQARKLKLLITRDAVSEEEFRQISQWISQAMPIQTIKNQAQ